MSSSREFIPLGIAVLTISDTRTDDTDKSGTLLSQRLQGAGHYLRSKKIILDDIYKIRAVVSNWCIEDDIQVVMTTGGTGMGIRDHTVAAVGVLFDKVIPGFGEVFRNISHHQIGTSTIQSGTTAGMINGRYVFCLPGSTHACTTAWDDLISYQLDYRTSPCNLVELMSAYQRIKIPST